MAQDVLLVPLDYTGCAFDVASYAAGLASRLGARAVLTYVVHLPVGVEPDAHVAGGTPLHALQKDAHTQLESLAQVFVDKGVPVKYRVDAGLTAPAILEAAKAEQATMIVMGTHGRTGVARLFLGSVAEQVVRGSSIPVLTLRAGAGLPTHLSEAQEAVAAEADG